jgi:medium-chain acyl-[acyl-carrier-protein] hydrolase
LALRLFCFPSAGSGAVQFNHWPSSLPPDVELNIFQLPGRETRLKEPLYTEAGPLIRELSAIMGDYLDAPYVFLGHSLGAMLAFETIRALRSAGARLPLHLFVIGRRAPHLPIDGEPMHRLSDERLVEWMRRLGGTPDKLLQMPEMMELFLPILRADLQVNETYRFSPQAPLELPISCFGGVQDSQASRAQLEAWREHTTAGFNVRMYPGGHFFLKDYQATLLRDIGLDLEQPSHER